MSAPHDEHRVLAWHPDGVRLVRRSRQVLRPGEVRVAIEVAGICRTDLFVANGAIAVSPGRVLGHEAAGRVIEAHADVPVGAHVAIDPRRPCGACAACRRSARCVRPCLLGVHLDGLFVDEAVVPAGNLVPVPDTLDARHAAFVEPAAAALAVRDVSLPLDERGLVVGTGRIGQLSARVLRSLGARQVRLAEPDEPVEPDHYAWAVETVPTTEGLACALTGTRPGGVVVLKSRPAAAPQLDVRLVVQKRLTLRGADYAPFDEAARWLGAHSVDDLLGEPLPLDRHAEAFAQAWRDDTRKAMLSFRG